MKERYGSMDTLLRMYVCPQKLHTNSPVRCEYLEGKGSKILFEASNKLVIIYICPKVDGPPDAICIRGGKALCNMYLQHSILFTSLSIRLDGELPKAEVAATTGKASIILWVNCGWGVGQFLRAQLLIVSPQLQQSGAYYLVTMKLL